MNPISNAPEIPRGADGAPVFAAPWEAKAFALAVALHGRGMFTWGEWSAALGREIAAHGGEGGFYEHWLSALEALVVEKRLADGPDLARTRAAWAEAAAHTPHGAPVELLKR